MVTLGLLACLIFAFGLISRRVEGTVVTAPTRRRAGAPPAPAQVGTAG